MIGDLHAGYLAIWNVLAGTSAVTTIVGGSSNPRIYAEIADPAATFPLILIQTLPSREDTKNASSQRIFANGNFRVVGVAKERKYQTVLKAAIDAAIELQSRVVSDNHVMTISRISEYRRMFVDNGIHYAWNGGDYRVTIK